MRRIGALVVALALTACQSGSPIGGGTPQSAMPTGVGVGPQSTFALATPAGLFGLAADGKILGRILDLPRGSVSSAPTLHPDGKRIVFALSDTTEALGFGSDIYSVNVDGSELRAVVKRDKPDVFYASPSFDANGVLYAHRRSVKQDATTPGVYLQTDDIIERIDFASGRHQQVVADAAEPTVAPSGKTIVFVHIDRGQQTSMWTASTDGTQVGSFLKTDDSFTYLQAPRISPSGQFITWSSAGRSGRTPRSVVPRQLHPSAAVVGGGGKLAHLDIPSELFVAPLDGSSLRTIATTNDDVVPAWSLDSTRIAFVASATLWVVSAADGAVVVKTPNIGVNYGDPVWLR